MVSASVLRKNFQYYACKKLSVNECATFCGPAFASSRPTRHSEQRAGSVYGASCEQEFFHPFGFFPKISTTVEKAVEKRGRRKSGNAGGVAARLQAQPFCASLTGSNRAKV